MHAVHGDAKPKIPRASLAERIKAHGTLLGFALVGVSPVVSPAHSDSFASWLRHGYQGEMGYLVRTAKERMDPGQFLPWAKSVISVGLYYDTPHDRLPDPQGIRGWISRYAWGSDYHDVMRARLAGLLNYIRQEAGSDVRGKAFVDSARVMERGAGARAGIGWCGKNTTLLSEKIGSFFFLGELFLDLELEWDQPIRNRCDGCRLCLDACPTDAFVGPYVLDARRCISYLTIELKEAIPPDLRPLVGNHIFGCDICQDVCPYNATVSFKSERAFHPREGMYAPELIPVLSLNEKQFSDRFAQSPILRAKREGFLRNVCVALGNLGRPEAVPALIVALAADPNPLVRGHAAWALGRIRTPDAQMGLRNAAAAETDPTVRGEIGFALEAFSPNVSVLPQSPPVCRAGTGRRRPQRKTRYSL